MRAFKIQLVIAFVAFSFQETRAQGLEIALQRDSVMSILAGKYEHLKAITEDGKPQEIKALILTPYDFHGINGSLLLRFNGKTNQLIAILWYHSDMRGFRPLFNAMEWKVFDFGRSDSKIDDYRQTLKALKHLYGDGTEIPTRQGQKTEFAHTWSGKSSFETANSIFTSLDLEEGRLTFFRGPKDKGQMIRSDH